MRSLKPFSNKILDHFGVSQKRNFISVITIFALFSIIFAFVSTFMTLKIQNLQVFSKNWMPFVLPLPYVGSFCGTLFFSYLAKKFSLKKMMILAFFFLCGGYLSVFFLLETPVSALLLFLFGILYRSIFLVIYVYQGTLFASRYQARLFSFAWLLYGLAMAFGSFAISQVSFGEGMILAIFLVVACLLISFRIKKDPKKESGSPLEESIIREFSYLEMIKQNPLFFLIVFVGYMTFFGFSTYYPFFGENLGLSEAEAGSFLASAQFFGLFLIPVGGYLGDKYGHEKSIFFIILLSLGGIGASFLTENVSLLSVFFAIAQGGMVAFYTLTTAWVAFLYPASNLIKGVAILNLVGQAGGMISPFGMGVMMRFFGNEGFIGWFFIGTAVVLGLLLMRMISHKKMGAGS